MRRLTDPRAWPGGILLGAVLALVPAVLSAETHRVVIERFAFVPAELSIRPGDTVRFVNRDLVPHAATDGEGRWDTGTLSLGAAASVTFEAAGTFPYVCIFHPSMRARIRVVPD